MWSRIRCKSIQNARNIFTIIDHHNYILLNSDLLLMVFLKTSTNLAASRSQCSENGLFLFEISDTGTIRMRLSPMRAEIPIVGNGTNWSLSISSLTSADPHGSCTAPPHSSSSPTSLLPSINWLGISS
ncbi:uncharacterized protein A4U43_C03F22940 [Asparagus officinalis]|uniref:Uncharacterized protein n=1 Tax=Asparagus officinalis TaxID=4686 RepID=A0A5P1FD82_ASPOF|nr:uncharacterized protein LOC109834256 [Asparagus officinalis]ONK76014.1 uncharacterized protein A4U43_C03F22940 [Asparagus officinalis]